MGPGSAARHFVPHCVRGTCSWSALLGLFGDPLQELLDLAVLLALAVGPFADHLLLGAHMRDQALYGLGEVGHRRRGGAAAAALFDHRAYALHRMLQFAADAGSTIAIFAHGGGEPVLQIRVE